MKRVILLFFWLLAQYTSAVTYYVDKEHATANDQNPGTDIAPWLTIQHAAETVTAGDTVYIKQGIYNEIVRISHHGTAQDSRIVLMAFPGDNPAIDGSGVEASQNGVVIDKNYITLCGLEICNWNGNAVWVQNAGYCHISDCEVHDVFFGIGVSDGSHDFVFDRVTVHHFNLYGFDVSPSGGGDCYNGVFNHCMAHTGRDPEQNVDGFALGHGTQHNFVFNNCTTWGVYDGFDISSRQVTLQSCLAYDCVNGCYKLWQDKIRLENCIGYNAQISIVELDWNGGPGAVTLINCTFYDSETFTIWIENAADTLNMYNCILAGGDNIGLAFEQPGIGNYHGDYNLFHNDNKWRMVAVAYSDEFTFENLQNGDWAQYSGQDVHSLQTTSVNTIFVDAANYDFHLIKDSPAIDAGTALDAPFYDFDQKPRDQGEGPDIGAFEYGINTGLENAGATRHFPENMQVVRNFPNPFNAATVIELGLDTGGDVQINIFDSLGRLVRRMEKTCCSSGTHRFVWDGTDDQCLPVSTGVYFCRVKCKNHTSIQKLLLVK